MSNLSPLRYPGGKYRFREFVSQVIDKSPQFCTTLVEPFCGGAGVSLALLSQDKVQSIALNDADSLVASFWMVVFQKNDATKEDFEWLLNQVQSAQFNLDAWKLMRQSSPSSLREKAWKCLFMNRTCFNGIIHTAGPIGGWGQTNRTLDARFNRDALCKKISALNDLRLRVIDVCNEDWEVFCNRFKKRREDAGEGCESVFFYIDPPYYHKAEQLYKHLFDHAQHESLKQFLMVESNPWLLSYDDSLEVRDLYSELDGVHGMVIDKKYSTHPVGGCSHLGRELLLSNQVLCVDDRMTSKKRGFDFIASMGASNKPVSGPLRSEISSCY